MHAYDAYFIGASSAQFWGQLGARLRLSSRGRLEIVSKKSFPLRKASGNLHMPAEGWEAVEDEPVAPPRLKRDCERCE